MTKTFTCILCPGGCQIEAAYDGIEVLSLKGNKCPRGAAYVEQELTHPVRTISTSVLVRGGELPLCSVRLTNPVPREKIFDVMGEIRKLSLDAPVQIGQILIHDVLGLGSDVIATRPIERVNLIEE
ncbi:DUF1667 domain-containing protein [uncultured Clostridium sp.]|uniref:DUF1667 domain-containing protein n=1 Tax=uncultured Clostridium sp. TaxID=59620 RepID=UPI0025E08810|nr:DUF1667 domain-containing protein [uncultured Clostridium sp.]